MVLLGENNYSAVENTYWYVWLYVFFVLFTFIAVILMLNLLVAIMSNTYADTFQSGTSVAKSKSEFYDFVLTEGNISWFMRYPPQNHKDPKYLYFS